MKGDTLKKLRMIAHIKSGLPSSLAPECLKVFSLDVSVLDAYVAGLFVVRELWLEEDSLDDETLLDYLAYTDGFIQKVGSEMGLPVEVIDDLNSSVLKSADKIGLLENDIAGLISATALDDKQSTGEKKVFSLAFAFVRDVVTIIDFKNLHPNSTREFVQVVADIVGLKTQEKKVLYAVFKNSSVNGFAEN